VGWSAFGPLGAQVSPLSLGPSPEWTMALDPVAGLPANPPSPARAGRAWLPRPGANSKRARLASWSRLRPVPEGHLTAGWIRAVSASRGDTDLCGRGLPSLCRVGGGLVDEVLDLRRTTVVTRAGPRGLAPSLSQGRDPHGGHQRLLAGQTARPRAHSQVQSSPGTCPLRDRPPTTRRLGETLTGAKACTCRRFSSRRACPRNASHRHEHNTSCSCL